MLKIMNAFFQTSGNKNSVSNEALEVWFDFFGELRPEIFKKALKLHAISSRFQPTPSEIWTNLEAIRIEMFSKINYQRSIEKTIRGEYELDEGETIEELKKLVWEPERLGIYEAELEKLNNIIAQKYGG